MKHPSKFSNNANGSPGDMQRKGLIQVSPISSVFALVRAFWNRTPVYKGACLYQIFCGKETHGCLTDKETYMGFILKCLLRKYPLPYELLHDWFGPKVLNRSSHCTRTIITQKTKSVDERKIYSQIH